MASKILFWGGKNGAFREPLLWCSVSKECRVSSSLKRKKMKKRKKRKCLQFKYLSIKEKKLLVYGYIRKYDDLYFVVDIINICFSFYNIKMDKWDINNSSKYLLYHQNRLQPKKIINLNNTSFWKNAFGSTVIQKGQRYRWKIKLCDAKTYYSIRIGIVDINDVYNTDLLKDNFEQSALDRVSNKAFVISCFTGYFWHKSIGKQYAKQCKNNSIIIMEIDLKFNKNGTLKYMIDGIDYGYATQNIDCNAKYILAVSLVNNESVILLEND